MKRQIVEITWIDSHGVTGEWEHIEDLKPLNALVCYSIGYILEENETYITITQSVSEEQVLGRMTIPQDAIMSILVNPELVERES